MNTEEELNNLDTVLRCSICLEMFDFDEKSKTVPIAFSCLHLVCKQCCEKIKKGYNITCPICLKTTKIDELKSKESTLEIILNQILEIRRIRAEKLKQDEKGESDKNLKDALKELNGIDDLKHLFSKITSNMDFYRSISIRIAFIGKSKVGKSTIINTLRGKAKRMKQNGTEAADLAPTDVIQCTKCVTGYAFFENKNILLLDVPGAGTPEFRQDNNYLKAIGFDSFDFVVLLSNDGFFEVDEWLLNTVVDSKKPYAFLYTKLDSTIENELKSYDDYEDMNENEKNCQEAIIIDRIRSECLGNISKLTGSSIHNNLFLLSGLKSKTHLYDFPNFNDFLLNRLPKIKRETIVLTTKFLTDKIILEKERLLIDRIENFEKQFQGFGCVKEWMKNMLNFIFKRYMRNHTIREIDYFRDVFGFDQPEWVKTNLEIRGLIKKYDNIHSYVDELINNSKTLPIKTDSQPDSHDKDKFDIVKKDKMSINHKTVQIVSEFLKVAVDDMKLACIMRSSIELDNLKDYF